MAEFWRALRTLKALQAEQALEDDAALAPRRRSAPRPRLADRAQPNEPERAALREPEYLPSAPPARGTLHETADRWLPNEPASVRHAGVVPGSRTNPKPLRSPTRS